MTRSLPLTRVMCIPHFAYRSVIDARRRNRPSGGQGESARVRLQSGAEFAVIADAPMPKIRPENPSPQSTFSPTNFEAIVCGHYFTRSAVASSLPSRGSIIFYITKVRVSIDACFPAKDISDDVKATTQI
jgi:hypothetical protein